MHEGYKILSDWFLKNELKLNASKTHFIYFTSPQRAGKVDLTGDVDIGGSLINPSESEKILGLTISSRMSMKYHLLEGNNSLVNKLEENCGDYGE